MMRRIILFLITIVMAFASATADNSAKYRYLYIEAVRQMDMQNYARAFELFRQCRYINPKAAETCFALGRLYSKAKQESLGLELIKRATVLAPENTVFAERLANGYLYTNQTDSAANVYERLSAMHPDRTEYLDILMRIYEHTKEYEKQLSVLNRYELQEGQSEDITLSKMQAYAYLDDMQGAYNEIKKLVDSHPYDLSFKLMMGNWLLSNGRKEEALKTFHEVLKEEPDNAQGQMSLMDYYRSVGETKAADSLLYDLLVNPHTETSTRVTLMSDWIGINERNGSDSARVINLINKVLRMPQPPMDVAKMKIAYLKLKNAPKDSIRAEWQEVLRRNPEDIEGRLSLIAMLWEDSIDENVIRECKTAIEYIPNEPALYQYLGIAQLVNEHNADALASFQRAASCITKETSKDLAAEIFGNMGDVLHKVGLKAETYAAYDSCLTYKPDDAKCLNNYAYFLSLDSKDLKKAETMSYRAITAEPNNGIYLDTYAWILYQQGRYEEARIYIEQAIKCETAAQKDSASTNDSTLIAGDILEHAGDIYFKLNRPTDALQQWNNALKSGVDDEATLRKKIKKYSK